MACYRRAKLVWKVLREFSSGSKPLFQRPVPYYGKISRVSDQWSSSFLSSRYGHLGCFKQTPNSLLVSANRKYFSQQKTYFSSLSLPSPRFGYPQRKYFYYALIGATLATAYLCNQETIPYSKRTHSVLVPRILEKKQGELSHQHTRHTEKVLPSTHPKSRRVTLIAEKLIGALQTGLRDDKAHGASQYWDHFDREVIVIDEAVINAYSAPGGKIVVSSGVLEHYKSDAMVAAVIGHEVAHIVARHCSEKLTKCLGLAILGLILKSPELMMMSLFYVHGPLSRKLEREADYIGMLLMASAGYHPLNMVKLWEEHARSEQYGMKILMDILNTHPSYKKRFQVTVLALEEAMTLFNESLSTTE